MNELSLYSLMREPPTYASMIVVVEDHCAWGDRTQYLHFDEKALIYASRIQHLQTTVHVGDRFRL